MSYQVIVQSSAEVDVAVIYRWIFKRSRQGAYRWHEAFMELTRCLKTDPKRYPVAADLQVLGDDVREVYFKTPKGKRYRALFIVVDLEVRVLHVRGPGQAPIQA